MSATLIVVPAATAVADAVRPTGPSSTSVAPGAPAGALSAGRWFNRVFVIVLENKDRDEVLRIPYFAQLARRGELLPNYFGVTHPSQPNYLALVGGATFVSDDAPHNVAARSIADLLEATGQSWTAYEEGLPKPCFAGKKAGNTTTGLYTRAHNPFISFNNIRTIAQRCAHIVGAGRLGADIAAGTFPTFALFAPNKNHDAHDRPLGDAARWLRGFLEPKLADSRFITGTLVVVTFDESGDKADDPKTHPVYCVLLGPMITPGSRDPARYDHYSLLRTIEDALRLGTLGRHDQTAIPIRH